MGMQQQQEKVLKKSVVGKRRKVVAAAVVVTVNLGILDGPVCFHPLHPPIFQVEESREMDIGELGPARDPARLLLGLLRLRLAAVDLLRGAPLGRVGGRLLAVLPELLLDVQHVLRQLDLVEHLLELGVHLHPRPGVVRVFQHGWICALHLRRREAVGEVSDEREQLVFALDAVRALVRVVLLVEAHLGVVPQALCDGAVAADVDVGA